VHLPSLKQSIRTGLFTVLSSGLLAAVIPWAAHANEEQDYDALIDQSANICPNYSGKSGAPALHSFKIETIRFIPRRHVYLCPDSKLTAATPVVWYGDRKVLVWNPEISGATDQAKALLNHMIGDDTFPTNLTVVDASGKPVTGHLIPSFEFRENPDGSPHY